MTLTSSLFETFLTSLTANSLVIVGLIVSMVAIAYIIKLVKRTVRGSDTSGRTEKLIRDTNYWIKENDRIDATYFRTKK